MDNKQQNRTDVTATTEQVTSMTDVDQPSNPPTII